MVLDLQQLPARCYLLQRQLEEHPLLLLYLLLLLLQRPQVSCGFHQLQVHLLLLLLLQLLLEPLPHRHPALSAAAAAQLQQQQQPSVLPWLLTMPAALLAVWRVLHSPKLRGLAAAYTAAQWPPSCSASQWIVHRSVNSCSQE
jgi:hypothetical protein